MLLCKALALQRHYSLNRSASYRPDNRSLKIVKDEADLVRSIFTRYLETGSVHVLAQQLEAEGVRSRQWTTSRGTVRGGTILTRERCHPHLKRVEVHPRTVVIGLICPANACWHERIDEADKVETLMTDELCITITAAVRPRGGRRSITMSATGARRARPDQTLISGLRRAHAVLEDHGVHHLSRVPNLEDARGIDDP